jgi:uncharacterized membrane protein (UPF0127 family)
MAQSSPAPRLRHLPTAIALGCEVRVATGLRARLLGLAHLDLDEAGPGLLIPRCSSIHTFGMRFALDLYFLDEDGAAIEERRRVPRGQVVRCRRAAAVVELPCPCSVSS